MRGEIGSLSTVAGAATAARGAPCVPSSAPKGTGERTAVGYPIFATIRHRRCVAQPRRSTAAAGFALSRKWYDWRLDTRSATAGTRHATRQDGAVRHGRRTGLLAVTAWVLLACILIPLAPSAEWPKNVGLAGLGVSIVAGGTFLYRKGGARPLRWRLLGRLLIASIGGMAPGVLTLVGGAPRG
ncbi:hypothetical protein BLA15945_02988 [Burkholderia lata]|uniref:Uncharacterized protein n=1 Tax=Burkholderia lata (strain ATCC 17760 / DSM 23089 / LMG 22485 / NCIMB 9086 / R18194 / 383) TaxID=482957 RepID=A0A6P2L8M2_BURL3|nr:hypothetical protein BLA15945_02988 [Burkholderia lata]